jgi:hypothetical protein
MMDDTIVRASDAERAATAELLRREHAEGRLTTDELDERLGRCYAAKTRGELDALMIDLPYERRQERRQRRRHGPYARPFPPLIALALLAALIGVTGGHALWLLWPLAFFAFMRVRRHS